MGDKTAKQEALTVQGRKASTASDEMSKEYEYTIK